MSCLSRKKLIIVLILCVLPFFCSAAFAKPEGDDEAKVTAEELKDEIERQVGELDLSSWQRCFEQTEGLSELGFNGVEDMLLEYSENGASSDPVGILGMLKALLIQQTADARGLIVGLTAAALITGLAGLLPQGGIKPVLSFALGTAAVLAVASAFAALCSIAAECIRSTGAFVQAAMPVMTVLLSAVGATASEGVLRPLMLFLSGAMITFAEKVLLPLILFGGIVNIVECIGGSDRLHELSRLITKTIKWLLGLASVLYFAVCALQGMTVSAADGISIRTAKYTLDRLLPSTNGLIGGSVDAFMSCALLVKNGAGAASIVIMLGIIAKPLIRIAAGMTVFRISAALARPVAAPAVTRMLSGAADMTGYLFGAAAIVGAMFAVTMMVFIAAGGASAGLW